MSLLFLSALFPVCQHPSYIMAIKTGHYITGMHCSTEHYYDSCDLDTISLLTQPKIAFILLIAAAHCWFIFNRWSTRASTSFFLVLNQGSPILNLCIWFFPSKFRTLYFFLVYWHFCKLFTKTCMDGVIYLLRVICFSNFYLHNSWHLGLWF